MTMKWLILAVFRCAVVTATDSLYMYQQDAGPIQEYTGSENDFLKSQHPRVVEFYSPHCSACVEFKSEYVQLAHETQQIYSDVEFYAVSCDAQPAICKTFTIEGTPSLYVFQEGSDHKGTHLEISYETEHYTSALLANALELTATPVTPGATTTRRMDDSPAFGGDEKEVVADESQGQEDEGEDIGDDGEEPKTQPNENNAEETNTAANDESENEDTEEKLKPEAESNDEGENEDAEEAAAKPEVEPNDEDENVDVVENAKLEAELDDAENKDTKEDAKPEVELNDDAEEAKPEAEANDGGENEDAEEEIETQAESNDEDENEDVDTAKANNEDNNVDDNNVDDNDEDENEDIENSKTQANTDANESTDDNNGDDDKTDSDEQLLPLRRPEAGQAGPGLRMQQRDPFGPAPGGRRPGAGHSRGQHQQKDMDRWMADMKTQRERYAKQREGLGKFVHHDNRKDKKGILKTKHDPDTMTEGMKAFSPGTVEHTKRHEKMQNRMKKAHQKMKIPSDVTAKTPLKKEALPYKKEVRKPTLPKAVISAVPIIGRRYRMTPEEELILDVSLSLVVGLESGVFMSNKPLNFKQRSALQDFLDLLSISLPPEWGIHRMIDELRRRFAYISQSDENLKKVLSAYPLPRHKWSKSCVSRSRGTMGYSCGFWKLLHVVTVGVAEQRGGNSLIESGMVGAETRTFSPMDAADAIRDYIDNFFTCAPCRKSFIENYDDCDNNRRCDRLSEEDTSATIADWKELPVWMWEVHNEVSARILREKEKKLNRIGSTSTNRRVEVNEIAAVWPNIETCFLCFNEDGAWNEAGVFKYLESNYWPDSELDPRSERLIHYEGDGSFEFGFLLWILMFVVLGYVYSLIGKTSPATLRLGMLQAKRMVAVGDVNKKKDRSN